MLKKINLKVLFYGVLVGTGIVLSWLGGTHDKAWEDSGHAATIFLFFYAILEGNNIDRFFGFTKNFSSPFFLIGLTGLNVWMVEVQFRSGHFEHLDYWLLHTKFSVVFLLVWVVKLLFFDDVKGVAVFKRQLPHAKKIESEELVDEGIYIITLKKTDPLSEKSIFDVYSGKSFVVGWVERLGGFVTRGGGNIHSIIIKPEKVEIISRYSGGDDA